MISDLQEDRQQQSLKERRTGAGTKLAPADVASRLKELLGPVRN
jgi:hypothetical protein